MIQSMYEMLAQEPWCFHPEQIASMTDWQIVNLYAKPANERAERMKAEREGRPTPPQTRLPDMPTMPNRNPIPEIGSSEMRTRVIAQYTGYGMTPAEAEARYERELAGWKKSRGE